MAEKETLWASIEAMPEFQEKTPEEKLGYATYFLEKQSARLAPDLQGDSEGQQYFREKSKQFLFSVAEKHFPSALEALPSQVGESINRETRATMREGVSRMSESSALAKEELAKLEGVPDDAMVPSEGMIWTVSKWPDQVPAATRREHFAKRLEQSGEKAGEYGEVLANSFAESAKRTPSSAMLQLELSEGWAGWDEFIKVNADREEGVVNKAVDFIGSVGAAITGTMAESSVQSAKGAVAGIGTTVATGNPIAGGAALGAVAADSEFQATYLSELQSEIAKRGGEPSSETIQSILADPEWNARVDEKARTRGLAIGATEGVAGTLSMGIANKIGASTMKKALLGVGIEAGTGAVGGSGGEFLARLFSGEDIWTPEARKDMLTEGVAELGQVGSGVATAVFEGATATRQPSTPPANEEETLQTQDPAQAEEVNPNQNEAPAQEVDDGPVRSVLEEFQSESEEVAEAAPAEVEPPAVTPPADPSPIEEIPPVVEPAPPAESVQPAPIAPAMSGEEVSTPDTEEAGAVEPMRTMQVSDNLAVNVYQNDDGTARVEKVNTETGEAIPLEGAEQAFPSYADAFDFVRDRFRTDEQGDILPEATPEINEFEETDPLMLWLQANPIRPVQDNIREIGRVSRRQEKGFRALDSDLSGRAVFDDVPLIQNYRGVAQERLRKIYRRGAAMTADKAASQIYAENPSLLAGPYVSDLWEAIKQRLEKVGGETQITSNEQAERAAADYEASREIDYQNFQRALKSPYRSGGLIEAGALQVGDVMEVNGNRVRVTAKDDDGVEVFTNRYGGIRLANDERVGFDAFEENGLPVAERENIAAEDRVTREEAAELSTFIQAKLGDPTVTAVPSREHSALAKNRAELEAARRLARLFGRRVVGVRNFPANGAVSRSDNANIYVAVDSSRTELLIVAHEMLHQMRQTDPDLYQDLLDVLDADLAAYVAEVRSEHSDKSMDALQEEFLADYLSDKAADPAFWESLSTKRPDLFERFMSFIRQFLDDLRETILGQRVGVERYLRDAAEMQRTMENVLIAFKARQAQEEAGILDVPLDESMPFSDVRFVDRRATRVGPGQLEFDFESNPEQWVSSDVDGNLVAIFDSKEDAEIHFRTTAGRGEFLWRLTQDSEKFLGGIPARKPTGPITDEDAARSLYPVEPMDGETPREAGNLPRFSPTGVRITDGSLPSSALRYGLSDFEKDQIGELSDRTGPVLRPLPKIDAPYRSGDIVFADERPTKPNQRVFGQDIGREDEIQSKAEVQAAVKPYFDGDSAVSYWSKEAAFSVLADIEAGRIEPTAETGLDGANQALVSELWRFANAMLREEGDASLLNRMRPRVNDYWNREATRAARALNARGWAQSPMEGTLGQVEEGKKSAVEKIEPGTAAVEMIEQVQRDADAIAIKPEDFSAAEDAAVMESIKGKRQTSAPGAPETAGEMILAAGRKKVGKNLRAVAAKLDALLNADNDVLFADQRINDGNRRTLIQKLIEDQAKTGRRKRGAFIATAMELGLSEEVAANRFDRIAEIRAEAKAARELDAKEAAQEKEEPTAEEKLLAELDEEHARLDRLNDKATKISERLAAGPKKRAKPDPAKKAPLDRLVADAIANGTSREEIIKQGLRAGLKQEPAARLADAIAIEQQRRAGRRKKGEKKSIDARARDLAKRFDNPQDRPARPRDELRVLINETLRENSAVTEQGFMDRMRRLGASKADSADLWASVSRERAKRQQIRNLRRQAARERRARDAAQDEAETLIKRLAASQSDTQDNRSRKRQESIVRELYRDAIGYGPVRSRQRFVSELEAAGVAPDIANRLFDVAMRERQNRTEIAKAGDANRVFGRPDLPATDKTYPAMKAEILAHPQLRLVGPEERLAIMAGIFRSRAGLADVDARAAAVRFDAQLVAKWEEATLRLAEETATKKNAPWFRREPGTRKSARPVKTTFDRLREAIRAGAMDPRKRLLDEVAKSNGWMDLTDTELQRLAELDAALSAPNLTPFEDVRHKRDMARVIRASALPAPLSKSIREYYLASIFSGVKTWVLQFSVLANELANLGLRDPAAAIAEIARGNRAPLDGYLTAMGNLGRYLKNAGTDGVLALLTGDIRGIQEAEILAAVSGLEQIHDRNVAIWRDPRATLAQKTAAAAKIFLAANRFFFRILSGIDNTFQGFIRTYTAELEAFTEAAALGIDKKKMRAMTAEVLQLTEAFAEEADAKGFTGIDKQAFVNDRISMAIFAALQGEGVNLDGIRDRSFREAALETGVAEFQTGTLPFGRLAKHLQKWSNEGGIISTLLVPVVRTPYQVLHRSAWWSPYGLVRLANVAAKTGGFRNWKTEGGATASPYETALADPAQLLRRGAETALGTAAFTALALLMAREDDKDEEDKRFRINLGGPSSANRTEFTAWRKTGRRPFTIQFKSGDRWITLGFRKGGMEFFNFAATLLGAWDQRKYNRYANSDSDLMNYVSTLGQELTGEALFFLRGFSSRYALASEETIANQIGFMLSGFVPAASLLKTPTRFRDYQENDSGAATSFLMQMPVVPWMSPDRPQLNSLGDPLGANEKERGYVQSKLGMPMGWVPFRKRAGNTEAAQDEDLYLMLFEKDYFPVVKARKEFGDISLDQYRQFVQTRGAAIKSFLRENYGELSAMKPDTFKDVLSNRTTEITKRVQRSMGLSAD